MKKIILGTPVLVLLAFVNSALASFTDVGEDHVNFDAITYVQAAGIVEGYSDETYRPDSTINRAEFTKIIIESQFDDDTINSCLAERGDELVFPDVPQEEWFAKYVCIAFSEGIVSGYPDGTYGPSKEISIVEAAKIIVNAFAYEVASDEIWYKPFMVELGDRNALPVTLTEFDQSITRGEMAEMIYRLLEELTTKDSTTYYEIAGEFTVVGTEFNYEPSTITVEQGQTVRIVFENSGEYPHNFIIDELDVSSETISPGETDTVEFTASASGTYTFYCSLPGHQQAGMEGDLTVEE